MCFVTHNRLILLIAVLSVLIGVLIFIASSLVIHNAEDLSRITLHIQFLMVCTFCTVGAGIIQTVSSLLFLFRKLITKHWIGTNALVFGILLVGICTAMVRFQSTLPEGFNKEQSSTIKTDTSEEISTPAAREIWNNTQDGLGTKGQNFDSIDDSSVELDDSVEAKSNSTTSNAELQNTGRSKLVRLLKFYFGSIMADFLILPIFLGLVSSKASKFELRGKNLIETW